MLPTAMIASRTNRLKTISKVPSRCDRSLSITPGSFFTKTDFFDKDPDPTATEKTEFLFFPKCLT